MTPPAKRVKETVAWAVVPPGGHLCLPWIFRTKTQADAVRRVEYPRNRLCRIARVRITKSQRRTTMAVDTSRDAVDRLALRMEGIARQTTVYASLDRAHAGDAAATLRALLARAEAAEGERDGAKTALVHTCLTLSGVERQRDAAIAEMDRLAEALRGLMAGSVWKEACLFIDGTTPIPAGWATKRMPSDEALTAARAALASIKKEPTDGE